MKKNKNIKNKKGTTLIEMMIFIVVFSVFLLLVTMMFKSVIHGHRFMKSRVDIKHNAAMALDFLCRDLMTAQAVKIGGLTVWPTPTISLNNYEIAVDYSKPGEAIRFYYKIGINSDGIKQLLRKRESGLMPLIEPKYDVVAEFIDDVIITKLYSVEASSSLYTKESYRIKVIAKSTGIKNVPIGTFCLISQVTPRSIYSNPSNDNNMKITPVEIEDNTNKHSFKIKQKPSL